MKINTLNFKDFCKENNLSEDEGFKVVLDEISRLDKEKEKYGTKND